MSTFRKSLFSTALLAGLTVPALAQAPANDDCGMATPVGTGTFAFDTTMSTTDGLALDPMVCDMGAFGDEQVHDDIWFLFTAPTTDDYDVTTFGLAGFDTRLAVYGTAGCPDDPMDVLVCNDDFNGSNPFEAGLVLSATATTVYKVRLGNFSDTSTPGTGDLLIGLVPPPPMPPANDDCGTAAAALVGLTTFDASAANDSADVLGATCGAFTTIFADAWFTFMATADADYSFELIDNGAGSYDTKMAVYGSILCPADDLDILACDDDGGAGALSMVTLTMTTGQVVLIRAGSFGAGTTENSIDLEIVQIAALVNDDCATAISVSVGVTPFDTSLATTDGLDLDVLVCDMGSFGDEQIHSDVWFNFTPDCDGTYDFQNINTSVDGRMAIYNQSTCPDDNQLVIACNDDNVGLAPGFSVALVGGDSYLVRIGGYTAGDVGTADLEITAPPAPLNDDCGNAEIVAAGITPYDSCTATTTGTALNELICDMGSFGDEQIHHDLWYSFTPTVSGSFGIASINNGNLTNDTRLAVYMQNACPGNPVRVIACDDDAGPNFEAAVDVVLTATTHYFIRVGTYSDTTLGSAQALEIVAPQPPPANDDCANATPVGVGTHAFDNNFASTDGTALDELVCDMGAFGDEQIHDDVWFCFTAPNDGNYLVTTFGLAGFDTRLAVYDNGCGVDDPALVIACNDDFDGAGPFEAGLSFFGTALTSYKVRLGNYGNAGGVGGSGGSGDLLIEETPNGVSFCYGDGVARDCPCMNNDSMNPSTGGCLNSSGTGAVLSTNGDASVSSNDLQFGMTGGNASLAVLVSGDNRLGGGLGIIGLPVSDGLRCVGGTGRRHGNRALDAMGATTNNFGNMSPAAGIIGQYGYVAGQTRHFQARYRENPMLGPCGTGINTSQAISITFNP